MGLLVILKLWLGKAGETLYGLTRMLIQLLIVGFILNFIFNADKAWIVLSVLAVMMGAASWISLRTVSKQRIPLLGLSLVAIFLGGGSTLLVVIWLVLGLDPWYTPQFVVPLAGMIFGGAMTSISLAAERLKTELREGKSFEGARARALKTALIPITNALFAVGLVSLPGMMTGQILSGVPPLIAVRYQIMVMVMLLAATGLSASCFLWLLQSKAETLFPTKSKKKKSGST